MIQLIGKIIGLKVIQQNEKSTQRFKSYSDIDPELNTDFEENSPFQKGVISEMYQSPDKSYFQEPQESESLINTGRLVQKFLLKQADIDKILKIIQRKVLKGTHLPVVQADIDKILKIIQRKVLKGKHLPVTVKEIQAGYLISPYFKDLYLYLAQTKLPSTMTAIQKVEMLAKRYILLDSLLFKIVTKPEKETNIVIHTSSVC